MIPKTTRWWNLVMSSCSSGTESHFSDGGGTDISRTPYTDSAFFRYIMYIMPSESSSSDIYAVSHSLNGSWSPVLTSFLWKRPNFDPLQNQNPWTDWNKIWHNSLRPGNCPEQNLDWWQSDQRGLLGKYVKYTIFCYFIFPNRPGRHAPPNQFSRKIA